MELRRAGLSVVALPEGAATPDVPRLRREGGQFQLELADGTRASGGWRDVRRALGIE